MTVWQEKLLCVAFSLLIHAAFVTWLGHWVGEVRSKPVVIEVSLKDLPPIRLPDSDSGAVQAEAAGKPAAEPAPAPPEPRPEKPQAKPALPPRLLSANPQARRAARKKTAVAAPAPPVPSPDPPASDSPPDIRESEAQGTAGIAADVESSAGEATDAGSVAAGKESGGGSGDASTAGNKGGGSVAGGAGGETAVSVSEAGYRRNPKPRYPRDSRRLREQGAVRLSVLVGSNGRAKEVRVVKGSGYPRLDNAAVTAVRQWEFVPAARGGVPMDAWYELTMQFRLNG